MSSSSSDAPPKPRMDGLFLFNSSWSSTEDTEPEKIVYWWSADGDDQEKKQQRPDVNNQLKQIGMVEGAVRFHGLFAEFCGAGLRALGQKTRRPRPIGIAALARGDGGGQAAQGVVGHVSLIGMPALAMCILASAME